MERLDPFEQIHTEAGRTSSEHCYEYTEKRLSSGSVVLISAVKADIGPNDQDEPINTRPELL